jgi:hypothetical protein
MHIFSLKYNYIFYTGRYNSIESNNIGGTNLTRRASTGDGGTVLTHRAALAAKIVVHCAHPRASKSFNAC